ncbi:sugar phosphate isomerase/epimerase [soil metagenome]
MASRRSFLKASSLIAAGSLIKVPAFAYSKKDLIGLQLYTGRDAMGKDPADTLAKVAAIGFNSVEGATYTGSQKFYGMDAVAFKALLKQNDLVMPSAHYRLGEEQEKGEPVKGTILHEWDKAVDDAAAVGIKYMVCAYLSTPERGNIDHYKYIAGELNKAGEGCKKAGIQLCYHNHDFEFQAQDQVLPYDILLNDTDKDLVKMELDLYWVNKAGKSVAELFEKNPGRFPLWHVKDMDNTPEHAFTEVGNGTIDFKKIFAMADKAGMKCFFVEQDKTPASPFDSIATSIKYIKGNLL